MDVMETWERKGNITNIMEDEYDNRWQTERKDGRDGRRRLREKA